MKSEGIKARFAIADIEVPDKPFFYTTDITEIHSLGLKETKEWQSAPITKDSMLTINGRKFKVVEMHCWVPNQLEENSGEYGLNVYGYGEMYPYNFEVYCYVKRM